MIFAASDFLFSAAIILCQRIKEIILLGSEEEIDFRVMEFN